MFSSIVAYSKCKDEICKLIERNDITALEEKFKEVDKNQEKIYDINKKIYIDLLYSGSTYMHYAAIKLRPKVIEFLHKKGLKVTTLDSNNKTVLHYMAKKNNYQKDEVEKTFNKIKFIIENNGTEINNKITEEDKKLRFKNFVNIKDDYKEETAIFIATSKNNLLMFNLLKPYSDLKTKNNSDYNLVHIAVLKNSNKVLNEIVKLKDAANLLEEKVYKSFKFNNVIPFTNIFLKFTLTQSDEETIKILIDAGVNINHAIKTVRPFNKENQIIFQTVLDLLNNKKGLTNIEQRIKNILIENGAKTYEELKK
jgi:ankyrin repeat protein